MAELLQLVSDSGTSIDLLGGTLKLQYNKWTPQGGQFQNKYQAVNYGAGSQFEGMKLNTETIGLVGQGTFAEIQTAVQAIDGLNTRIHELNLYQAQTNYVWLRWTLDGESSKQSLVFDIGLTWQYFREDESSNYVVFLNLEITRHAVWEVVTPTTYVPSNWSNPYFNKITTLSYGTTLSRLVFTLTNDYHIDYKDFNEFWVGFHPYKDVSDTDNLDLIWEAEDGTLSADSSITALVTASNGNYVTSTLTGGFAKRVTLILGTDVTTATDLASFAGTYLILMRAKLDGGSDGVTAQLFAGGRSETNLAPIGEKVYLNSAAWYLYPMGEISLPPLGKIRGIDIGDLIEGYTLELWAERISGSANLETDCFYLVPTEHFLHAQNFAQVDTSENVSIIASVEPNDEVTVYSKAVASVGGAELGLRDSVNYTVRNFYLPAASAFALFFVGQNTTFHAIQNTHYAPTFSIYQRYHSLR